VLALESAVTPLDAARRAILQLATRSRFVTQVIARRDTRLACLATTQVIVLFLLAVRIPVALFFLGPVLFGVAHLAADVRYLALQRAPPRALVVASVVLALALTAVRAAAGFRLVRIPIADQIDVVLGMVWVALALGLALSRSSARKVAFVAPAFLLVAATVVTHPRLAGLVLVHAHNVIAVVAWLVLFRRRPAWTVVPLLLMVIFAAVLLSGLTLPWAFEHGGMLAFGTRVERLGAWMTPGLSAELGAAVATTFVFMQGVHYAVWIG
jgi:hypothetical protein